MLAEPMPRYGPAHGNVNQRSMLRTAHSRDINLTIIRFIMTRR
jgi:hypothetical protein